MRWTAAIAQRSRQVDAVDRSAEMIAEARRRTLENVNCAR
jgi:ubiquinone/menaquinone biosynthesis C-methylase UbiE